MNSLSTLLFDSYEEIQEFDEDYLLGPQDNPDTIPSSPASSTQKRTNSTTSERNKKRSTSRLVVPKKLASEWINGYVEAINEYIPAFSGAEWSPKDENLQGYDDLAQSISQMKICTANEDDMVGTEYQTCMLYYSC